VAEINLTVWGGPAVGVLLVTSLIVLASHDWRWTIAALGLQYTAVLVLVGGVWRLELAVVKLVAGWMATAILGASQDSTRTEREQGSPSGVLFRVLLGGMVALTVFSLAGDGAAILEGYLVSLDVILVAGGLLLMGMGLAVLGLTSQPLRVALALLVFFSGFEILYAIVEDSTLVAGLLAVVNLSLASIGAYLHAVPSLERSGADK
jgi:MFS family permease